MAKARLESLQQKEKQYRDLMSKLSGNSEKRLVLRLMQYILSNGIKRHVHSLNVLMKSDHSFITKLDFK